MSSSQPGGRSAHPRPPASPSHPPLTRSPSGAVRVVVVGQEHSDEGGSIAGGAGARARCGAGAWASGAGAPDRPGGRWGRVLGVGGGWLWDGPGGWVFGEAGVLLGPIAREASRNEPAAIEHDGTRPQLGSWLNVPLINCDT